MAEFPETLRVTFRGWTDDLVRQWLVDYGAAFDAVSRAVLAMLLHIEAFLLWLPWWVAVLAVALIGWRVTRRWWVGLSLGALLMVVGVLGMWDKAMQTLAVVGTATVISVIVGIPVGVLMARSRLVEAPLRPVLDAMQTMPIFVYLIPALMFFGLGKVPGVIATVIYAIPPVIRLTNLGIRRVSQEVLEAAAAFGSTRLQLLWEVQLPLALPTIMAGVNQTTMMALAMVVIASMIGAGGVGEQVLLSIQRIEIGRGLEAGLSIVALAIVIDRLTQGMARRWDPDPQGEEAERA